MSRAPRLSVGVVLVAVGVCASIGVGWASHNGPTRAEVLGFDARQRRVYFVQFDESEVAYAPSLQYFDFAARRPGIAVRMPGPLYQSDEGVARLEAAIDSLRASLIRPVADDTATFVLNVRATPLPDSVIVGPAGELQDHAARFALTGKASGAGLSGAFSGTGFFEPRVNKVSAWRIPSLKARVLVVSWQGVWIGSGDELESCVLLARERVGSKRVVR